MPTSTALNLTPRAKTMLERAAELAAADPEYSNGTVGVEHIQLAILDDDIRSVAGQVMDAQGIDRAALRAALEEKMRLCRTPTTQLRDKEGNLVDPARYGFPDT